ncbi:MAG: hypothetical protein ACI8QZ_002290 [Chlamydiales bacterium]|jgi:hypothetical protein
MAQSLDRRAPHGDSIYSSRTILGSKKALFGPFFPRDRGGQRSLDWCPFRPPGTRASWCVVPVSRSSMIHPCLRPLFLTFLAAPAAAQVIPIAPFVGELEEGFESLVPAAPAPCLAIRIFDGLADLCTPGTSGATVRTSWSFQCDLEPHSGALLYGSSQGRSVYRFGQGVSRFGGYFASNGEAGTVHVRFVTRAGTLIDEATVDVSNDCSWTWNGWETTGDLIDRIQIVNSSNGGGFVMMDDMRIDFDGLGTSYCEGSINSTGESASISALGTSSVAANDLVLMSTGQPPSTRGLFYYGGGTAHLPLGDGYRCVGSDGSGLQRLPLETADQQGVMRAIVDNTRVPTASLRVFAGSTWYFQALYRDPPGGRAGFNLTDALALTFLP